MMQNNETNPPMTQNELDQILNTVEYIFPIGANQDQSQPPTNAIKPQRKPPTRKPATKAAKRQEEQGDAQQNSAWNGSEQSSGQHYQQSTATAIAQNKIPDYRPNLPNFGPSQWHPFYNFAAMQMSPLNALNSMNGYPSYFPLQLPFSPTSYGASSSNTSSYPPNQGTTSYGAAAPTTPSSMYPQYSYNQFAHHQHREAMRAPMMQNMMATAFLRSHSMPQQRQPTTVPAECPPPPPPYPSADPQIRNYNANLPEMQSRQTLLDDGQNAKRTYDGTGTSSFETYKRPRREYGSYNDGSTYPVPIKSSAGYSDSLSSGSPYSIPNKSAIYSDSLSSGSPFSTPPSSASPFSLPPSSGSAFPMPPSNDRNDTKDNYVDPVNAVQNQQVEVKKELEPEPQPQKIVDERYDFSCVICQEAKKDTVLLPCRHLCACQKCTESVDLCPLCRNVFKDTLTVFT